ncbi:hypothetical protein H9L39_00789 [Fusarium oxysporum f. sp. albedinis]|nr:hypothetical protein H9L39_00789 [Fusarium oxysporum f. sp. albedinis]
MLWNKVSTFGQLDAAVGSASIYALHDSRTCIILPLPPLTSNAKALGPHNHSYSICSCICLQRRHHQDHQHHMVEDYA